MPDLRDIPARSAETWPHRAAIVDRAGSVDYQTLFQRIETLRAGLSRLGISPGQGVGLAAEDGSAFVVGLFAILRCGAVVVPLFHRLPPAEIEHLIRAARLHAILDDGNVPFDPAGARTRINVPGERTFRLTTTQRNPAHPLVPQVPDAAFVRFTSGTTGHPKGVVLSHGPMLDRITAANRGLDISDRDTILWVLPMAFHFVVSIVLYLRYGATIVVCPSAQPEILLETARRHQVSFFYASPFHCRVLAAEPPGPGFPSTLRRVLSTSASLPRAAALAFRERYAVPVSQAYGIIEVGLPLVNLDRAVDRPEAVGLPLPDYEVAIRDETGKAVPEGRVGELAVRGPGMFSAYLDPPQPAEKILRDGWFFTGDLARRSRDGCVEIAGRAVSRLSAGDEKVFPEEIEAVLDSHPGVLKSRVLGTGQRPGALGPAPAAGDRTAGQVIQAEVVPCDPAHAPTTGELSAWCRLHLPAGKVPRTIVLVDRIPETPTGKVARHGGFGASEKGKSS